MRRCRTVDSRQSLTHPFCTGFLRLRPAYMALRRDNSWIHGSRGGGDGSMQVSPQPSLHSLRLLVPRDDTNRRGGNKHRQRFHSFARRKQLPSKRQNKAALDGLSLVFFFFALVFHHRNRRHGQNKRGKGTEVTWKKVAFKTRRRNSSKRNKIWDGNSVNLESVAASCCSVTGGGGGEE